MQPAAHLSAINLIVHKCTKFGCTRHSRNKFRSALVGTNSLAADVECIESVGAVGAVFEECSFSAYCESGKPMTSDSASFSPPLSFRKPLRRCRNSERKPRQNIAEVTILYEYLFRYFKIALLLSIEV